MYFFLNSLFAIFNLSYLENPVQKENKKYTVNNKIDLNYLYKKLIINYETREH